ncbi:MAG: HD domain-containing phosphohydrolase [Candidatus Omnitrophota bacterium]
MSERINRKAPTWSKLQKWFFAKLESTEGGITPLGPDGFPESQIPAGAPKKIDYQPFLEQASKSMIRFKKPEHLIRMIVRTIDRHLKVTHTGALLYKQEKNSYIIIDSKGEGGLKIPIGFVRIQHDSPIIAVFNERNNPLISETGTLNYSNVIRYLKDRYVLEKNPDLYDRLIQVKKQMDMLRANICVPCFFKRDLLGVLIMGEKLSGDGFSRDELGFFVTLANDAAMAITNAQLIDSLQQKVEEIKDLYQREHHIFIHTAIALAAAIDARDPYTHGHTERVTNYCMAVARELDGLPDMDEYTNFLETLQIAALLHDVGKIGIPDHILNKTGKLEPDEFETIKKHPAIGALIIRPIKELEAVAREVRAHQEAYDGSGYPDGLKGEEIPFIARIIAVADTFDAITTDRPYRGKKSAEEAIRELKKFAGNQFDPVIVSALILSYEKGYLSPRANHRKNGRNGNGSKNGSANGKSDLNKSFLT